MMLSLSNAKLSMLYNLVTVGEASWVILGKLLDKQQFKDVVQHEDVVQFYNSSTSSKAQHSTAASQFSQFYLH
jgi:hypothetical protein